LNSKIYFTSDVISDFKRRLEELQGVLKEVESKEADPDPVEACKKLQLQFGEDFHVPEVNETAQRKSPAIVSSSSSA
jgi:hypothetical protein